MSTTNELWNMWVHSSPLHHSCHCPLLRSKQRLLWSHDKTLCGTAKTHVQVEALINTNDSFRWYGRCNTKSTHLMLDLKLPLCSRPVFLKLRKCVCVCVEPLWLSMIFSEPLRSRVYFLMQKKYFKNSLFTCNCGKRNFVIGDLHW